MRRIAVAGLIGVLGAAGCGGGSHKPAPTTQATPSLGPPARAADVAVIRRWVDALRHGDVAGADSMFSVPVVVQNGTPPLPLTTRAQIHGFDISLPCGARLVSTVSHHGYVLAAFVLTERQGPGGGHCDGPGDTAATAFRIVRGRIREWRRITGLPGQASPGAPQT